jgi:predicted transport protein
MSWKCPRCDRSFRRANQRHACGSGDASGLLENRPAALVRLYERLEATVRGFGDVEVVTRDRYALFRTTRIFADLTVMREALRVVIHLGRRSDEASFIKVGRDRNRFSHVALVQTAADLRRIVPYLREAFALAASEESRRRA